MEVVAVTTNLFTLLCMIKPLCSISKFHLNILSNVEPTRCFAIHDLFHLFKRVVLCLICFLNFFLTNFQLICPYSICPFHITFLVCSLLYASFLSMYIYIIFQNPYGL